jgi:predicted amidohydrolase
LKIGLVQFAPTLGNLDKTISNLDHFLKNSSGMDLLVLPELANSGYNFNNHQQAQNTSESVSDSRFINFLEEKSGQAGNIIVSGFNEIVGKKLYNSAIVIDRGNLVGKYQKLHLFYREKEFFKPGKTGLPVFDIGGVKIGIQICFDWMFPEAWRVLTLKGVDIICHPSNLVLPGLAQRAVPVHAMINRIFTITANRIGSEGDLTFTGASTIANPKGEVLAQASATQSEVIAVEIDPLAARDKQITSMNHILKDRRPNEYRRLIE